ncbi:MAG TPA: Rnase Y domain-containing protein, partial [Streptosporangiaceae bacterium]
MSSTISLVIGAVGLLAAVFALIVVLRRPPARDQPAVVTSPEPPVAESAGLESTATAAAAQRALEEAGQKADQIRSRAETEAAVIVREAGLASDKAAQASRDAEEELRTVRAEARDLRADLERREARLAERESRLDAEFGKLEQRSAGLDQIRSDLETRRADLDRLDEERRQVLEQTAGLTADQAKAELVSGIQNQAKREAALLVRETENAARRDGEERARRIVTLAIQRVASEQTSESVVSVLHLPGDEMKGRIIG